VATSAVGAGAVSGSAASSSAAADFQLAARVFLGVLRCVLLVGLLIGGLGSAYAGLLVRLCLGRWAHTSVPALLQSYCVYVAFLALNGCSEAFAMAAADSSRLRTASGHLAGSAALAAAAAAATVPAHGARALICINCAVMALRSASSLAYAHSLLQAQAQAGAQRQQQGLKAQGGAALSLSQALPRASTLLALGCLVALAHCAAAAAPVLGWGLLQQLATAGCLGGAALAAIGLLEGAHIRSTVRELRQHK
jgi:hypothetical protein